MTHRELDRQLRTVLAQLELVSSAPTSKYDASGGDNEGDDYLGITPPADRYRRRLTGVEKGLRRRLDAAEAVGNRDERESEQRKALTWRHEARCTILKAAQKELAELTGRDGKVPEHRVGKLDTEKGIEEAITEEAPSKPAEQVASKLGVSVFIVRRRYVELGLDPHDGTELSTVREDRISEVKRLAGQGMGERQIAMALGLARGTVRRAMGKAA